MKIVEPKYEILTDISEGGIKELQQIERVARVCYKSEVLFKAKWTTGLTTKAISCKSRLTVPPIWFMQQMQL